MLNSDIIDVAIGMCLIFLMASLICTGIQEGLEVFLKKRASDLKRGILQLLHAGGDSEIVQKFYEHPMIFSLFDGDYDPKKSGNLPSYIPSGNFASALIDIVARHTPQSADVATIERARTLIPTIEQVRAAAQDLPSVRLRQAVLVAIDQAQGDMEMLKKNLESYFDAAMDRVSGWYKRRTQWVLFVIGVVMAVTLNVDAIHIAARLTQDKSLRQVVVAQAQKLVPVADADAGAEASAKAKSVQDLQKLSYNEIENRLSGIGLPIGWNLNTEIPNWWSDPRAAPQCNSDGDGNCHSRFGDLMIPFMILGWFITALAVMLGAPFWFDALNKLMVIRSTVKPSEKSAPEASKDAQPSTATPQRQDAGQAARSAAPDVDFEPHTWVSNSNPNLGVL